MSNNKRCRSETDPSTPADRKLTEELLELREQCNAFRRIAERQRFHKERYQDMLPDNICYDACDGCAEFWFEGQCETCTICESRHCETCGCLDVDLEEQEEEEKDSIK